jgi:anti-anti-sigma factor
LDLSDVNFISSTGFGVIAKTHQNLMEEGRKLFILNPTPSVEHLLKIINFDKFIPFIKSIEERKISANKKI